MKRRTSERCWRRAKQRLGRRRKPLAGCCPVRGSHPERLAMGREAGLRWLAVIGSGHLESSLKPGRCVKFCGCSGCVRNADLCVTRLCTGSRLCATRNVSSYRTGAMGWSRSVIRSALPCSGGSTCRLHQLSPSIFGSRRSERCSPPYSDQFTRFASITSNASR